MWTRRHASWWRTSWLTTKGCRTRKAMATASNWTRSLCPLTSRQAVANYQTPGPSRLPGLQLPALHCHFPCRKMDFRGAFRALGCSPTCDEAHLTCTEFLIVPWPEWKANFISDMPHIASSLQLCPTLKYLLLCYCVPFSIF